MQKLSGLVLDVYDDSSGEVMRGIFPTLDEVPDIIKQAHAIAPEEHGGLPDDAFSLVLENDGATLRKFACIDVGNTALSVEYFLKTAHKLPAEAQKTAASNLVTACGWYDIEPPEQLTKIALGLGQLAMGALVLPGAASEAKKNVMATKGAGPQVLTPAQIQQRRMQMGVG